METINNVHHHSTPPHLFFLLGYHQSATWTRRSSYWTLFSPILYKFLRFSVHLKEFVSLRYLLSHRARLSFPPSFDRRWKKLSGFELCLQGIFHFHYLDDDFFLLALKTSADPTRIDPSWSFLALLSLQGSVAFMSILCLENQRKFCLVFVPFVILQYLYDDIWSLEFCMSKAIHSFFL